MGILEDAKSTLALLSKVKAVTEGANEAKAIDQLHSQLTQLSAPISRLACNALVLRQEGVSLSRIPELEVVADTVKKAHVRFVESPKATTLRQGTRWTTLTKKLEVLAQTGVNTQTSDWQKFFENNYFGGPSPAQRRATLAGTPENLNAIERYRVAYQALNKYRTQLPKDSEDFDTLRLVSKQLAEITFQENVPEDVSKFLDATSFGAGLDLLTPEVLDWLRENNLLANFTVRAKAN